MFDQPGVKRGGADVAAHACDDLHRGVHERGVAFVEHEQNA